jgi:hypothetical protein
MTDDWWPKPLAHVAGEDPWSHNPVVVAEVRSFNEQPHAGHRTIFAALVPLDQISVVETKLARLNHQVSASGPHPFYREDPPFKPEFWVGARGLPSEKYEPLILTWTSHDKTVLQPDPGFLMTYGLVPRSANGEVVYWDDPQTPRHDIVTVTAPLRGTFRLAPTLTSRFPGIFCKTI